MGLNEFLVKAKANTYASSGEGKERKLEDGSKELAYQEEGWKYRDKYFGFNPFIGEEVVWRDDVVVWGMNYYGRIIDEKVPAKAVYEFLKKALGQVEQNRPFRGLKEFNEGEFNYANESKGAENNFEGTETIYWRGKKAYELRYHGGIVKK